MSTKLLFPVQERHYKYIIIIPRHTTINSIIPNLIMNLLAQYGSSWRIPTLWPSSWVPINADVKSRPSANVPKNAKTKIKNKIFEKRVYMCSTDRTFRQDAQFRKSISNPIRGEYQTLKCILLENQFYSLKV